MAPKKGQGNRRGGDPKKPPKAPSEPQEGSHIIFTNSKDEPKAKPKLPLDGAGAAKGKDGQTEGEEQPKKPDVRTLIGGASWTGKLPLNLLSEHCQKQRWEKPEYTMVG